MTRWRFILLKSFYKLGLLSRHCILETNKTLYTTLTLGAPSGTHFTHTWTAFRVAINKKLKNKRHCSDNLYQFIQESQVENYRYIVSNSKHSLQAVICNRGHTSSRIHTRSWTEEGRTRTSVQGLAYKPRFSLHKRVADSNK
jgi:hypothetical protein